MTRRLDYDRGVPGIGLALGAITRFIRQIPSDPLMLHHLDGRPYLNALDYLEHRSEPPRLNYGEGGRGRDGDRGQRAQHPATSKNLRRSLGTCGNCGRPYDVAEARQTLTMAGVCPSCDPGPE